MSDYREVISLQKIYVLYTVVLCCVLGLNEFSDEISIIHFIIPIVIIICGLCGIVLTYLKFHILISPITIFSFIWMILLPITSFKYPLMEQMTQKQWEICILGEIVFCIGGLICCIFRQKFKLKQKVQREWVFNKSLYFACYIIIIISLSVNLLQAYIAGGFPVFSSNVSNARETFFLPGLSFVSVSGCLPIYLIYNDSLYRKRKAFIVISIIYIIVQLLVSVRFIVFLLFILLLATYSDYEINKKMLKRIMLILFFALIAFGAVTMVRGGIEDKQSYFIKTQIYNGSALTLVETEIFRYFGMSQRTMEAYMNTYSPGLSHMTHTFSPILNAFGINYSLPQHFGIYGYTACNIITYFYFDAGNYWWILMFIWSFMVNGFYFLYKDNKNNILRRYLWGVSLITLTMSFYCYINAYTFIVFEFLVILIILNYINRKISIK